MSTERKQRAERAEQMRKEREKAERKQRNLITVGIVVVVLALVAVGGYAITSTSKERSKVTDVVTPKGATKDYGVPYTPEDAGGKSSGDTVPVVIYEDFQCPGCRAFEQANGKFLEDAVKKGEISIEFRVISFLDRTSPNQYSSRAGGAAMCAFESGGGAAYRQLSNIFFANQPQEGSAGPEDPALIDTLKQAGVDDAAAESCVTKGKFVPWVKKATEASRDAKVQGTPTIRIDGKDVRGKDNTIPQTTDLQKAIDAAKGA